jgi:hypothetical protein
MLIGVGLATSCGTTAPSPSTALSANVVDPEAVDAVSMFNSCAGHAFPQTNSPNSAKNYFWPTSVNFSTNDQLREYAACDGTINQNSDDTAANEQDRGQTFHLSCDGGATAVRYFHLRLADGLLGQHVRAADFIGFASMVGTGQSPSATWQNSSNFDVAVVQGNDNTTVNYFSSLTASALAAWASRGLTSVAQTVNPGSPTCQTFASNIGSPDILSFTPVR